MKKTKRILSMLLALIMAVCMLSVLVFAVDEETTYSVRIFATVDGYGTTTDIGGSISGAGDYKAGETVTLTVTPNSGYCSITWGSNSNVTLPTGSQSTMTVSFTMPAEDVQITGSFRAHTLGVFYEDLGNGKHDSYCFYCKEKENSPAEHIDLTDYTGEGEPDGSCDICRAEMHTHSHSTLKYDGNNHWYECSCGDKKDESAHEYDNACDASCNNEGCKHTRFIVHEPTPDDGNCTMVIRCAICKEITTEAKEHSFDNNCDTTCNNKDCKHTRTITHTPDEDDNDCSTAIHCSLCDAITTQSKSHDFTNACDTTCNNEGCEHTRFIVHEPTPDDGDCTTAIYCAICNVMTTEGRLAHTPGAAATTTTPQTCTVCGYVITPTETGYTLTIKYYIWGNDLSTGKNFILGAGYADKKITVAPGTVVNLRAHYPFPTTSEGREGGVSNIYEFLGFSENDDNTGDLVYTVTMDKNKTLYARWTMDEVIIISFEPKGGTMVYTKARSTADTIYSMNRSHVPVRAGYDFVGWSLEDDSMADANSTKITADCTLYAVWQSNHHDDDYYDPLPGDEHISVGVYDAILRDTLVFVGTNSSISGTLDLGETRAEAIRLPGDAVSASTGEGNTATIHFPGGTAATITVPAWSAAAGLLQDGEDLQIAVKQVGAPEELIAPPEDDEPYADDAGIAHYSVFIKEEIFTYDELSELGVIGGIGAIGESISWRDMKFLYHYMTTEELRRLYLTFSGGSEDLEPFVDWLGEMIERDRVPVFPHIDLLNRKVLNEDQSDKLHQLGIGMYGVPSIGQLRQLCLSMDQLRDLRRHALYHRYPEDHALLAWIDDAIAHEKQKLFGNPTYISIGGERGVFVAAVEADVKAVERASGSTRNLEILADRSDAVAWSTNIDSAWLEEEMAEMKNATGANAALRAYKVLDNGGLVEKAVKVTMNADGTLTASALSNGNSTYVFLLVPEENTEEEHTHNFEWVIDKEATETEDGLKHEECACGEKQNENTVIPKIGTENSPIKPDTNATVIVWMIVGVAAVGIVAVAVAVVLKKRRENI